MLALGSPYQGYVYSYPHKSAYGPLETPRRLKSVWADEDKSRLFLYAHLPFCEMRCGFCNLLTTANPQADLVERYLNAFERQARIVASELGATQIRRMAIGGGTPTFLTADQLKRLFEMLAKNFGADPNHAPCSVETSPQTATPDRLATLQALGVQRLSIGVQSFDPAEARAMGRPQKPGRVTAALDAIRAAGPFALNIDLIYGAHNQTPQSFEKAIETALHWRPESLYLYPLYIRPKTGLDGKREVWDQSRLSLYRTGRALLLDRGYEQISMRHFRKTGAQDAANAEYVCQEDAMLGLGAGARSYVSGAHYSSEFAVSRGGVLSIIEAYCAQTNENMRHAAYGVDLSAEDQINRYILKSVLHAQGLDLARFAALFGAPLFEASPLTAKLARAGCFQQQDGKLTPTPLGLEWADAIGPMYYSRRVTKRMEAFETI